MPALRMVLVRFSYGRIVPSPSRCPFSMLARLVSIESASKRNANELKGSSEAQSIQCQLASARWIFSGCQIRGCQTVFSVSDAVFFLYVSNIVFGYTLVA